MNCKRILALSLVIALAFAFAPSVWADEPGKININQASVEELVKLKKIGPKYAERIVQYREQHGAFQKPEDIRKVQGIGQKTFELNKALLTVE